MTYQTKKLFLFFSLFCLFTYSACKDDDDSCSDPTDWMCPSYDPCVAQRALTADFVMKDSISTSRNLVTCNTAHVIEESDSVRGTYLYFEARHIEVRAADITYEWEFENDQTLRYGKEVRLSFNNFGPGSVKVTLRMTLNNGGRCPEVDGEVYEISKLYNFTDTYDRTFDNQSKVYGRYTGAMAGSSEERTIEIKKYQQDEGDDTNSTLITNLFDGCTEQLRAHGIRENYRHFLFAYSGGTCGTLYLCGSGQLSPDNNTLTIDFTRDIDGVSTPFTWVGERVE